MDLVQMEGVLVKLSLGRSTHSLPFWKVGRFYIQLEVVSNLLLTISACKMSDLLPQ